MIVTNRATAGGAEIAAAALLDNKRAQVVGERTYGDAGVRSQSQMDDGAAVILSVAKYFAPSGKAIQDTGVVPTVQVAETDTSPDYDENGNPIPGSEPKNVRRQSLEERDPTCHGKEHCRSTQQPGSRAHQRAISRKPHHSSEERRSSAKLRNNASLRIPVRKMR